MTAPPPLQRADAPGLPLADVRVVALEHAVAAPLCSRHLADLGADVVKIEHPDGGDFSRHYDGAVDGLSANFVWLNHGKRSIVLDLRSDPGRAALDRLLACADVFIHNLGPGAVDRLGFGADACAERYPRLIWCSISGYGPEGPYRDRKGFDLLLQGEAGVLAITGSPGTPAKVGVPLGDTAAGIYAAASILAVLYERERTGRGRRIDIALFDVLAEWMSYPLLMAKHGREFAPAGARHARIVPYGPYRCGDGRLVNLAVQNDGQWRRLCDAVGHPEWADDPLWGRPDGRLRDRDGLERALEQALSRWPAAVARDRLVAADVPVGDVNELADVVGHPQVVERDRWGAATASDREVPFMRHPFGIAGLPERAERLPGLGEQTDEVLAEVDLLPRAPRVPPTGRSRRPRAPGSAPAPARRMVDR
jgi:crotonobetainyl-CoA:carnitine CoA-transferase CaiB-like acyl-CoA transferase